ncbi:hypothetical protein FACS189493_2390 [Spirochaetia bacterium]|nr:hypothetical protein FACS189493_2390 [Spirochaetia bacterium]
MEPIIAILSLFVAAPIIVFSFIYMRGKNRADVEKMQIQKEIMELEVEKEKVQLLRLEAENKKYDAMIKD